MKKYTEGRVSYEFPDQFLVIRPENSIFYRKHWQHFAAVSGAEGIKECDFIAHDPGSKTLWLVETKDYRRENRTKPSELGQEFALKCRDSLSCLAGIKLSSFAQPEEKDIARDCLKSRKVRCVLHIEQGRRSKLFPPIVDPKSLKDSLRRWLRPLDSHAEGGDASVLVGRIPFAIEI
jgi:hypothetical protein